MAATKKQSTAAAFRDIMAELKSGKVAPVYLLMGAESYYIDKVSEWIQKNLLKEEEKDFNLSIFYASDNSTTAQSIIDNARRYPIMAKRQVIIVRDMQALKNIEPLEKYLDNPVPSTVLVLCYMNGTIDARKKIVSRTSQIGRLLVSEPLKYDRDIIAFINDYISRPEYKATIDNRAAEVMAAHIGGDMKRMSSELDKLQLSFAPGAPRIITQELIEQKIGISKQFNVFEMRDALIKKDALKAHSIAKYFNSNPKAGGLFALLPLTFSYFQNLMLCHYVPKPVNDNAIMAQLGLKSPWGIKDYIEGMKNFSPMKTIQIISKIREVDARSKGLDNVSTPPEELLQELVSFILH